MEEPESGEEDESEAEAENSDEDEEGGEDDGVAPGEDGSKALPPTSDQAADALVQLLNASRDPADAQIGGPLGWCTRQARVRDRWDERGRRGAVRRVIGPDVEITISMREHESLFESSRSWPRLSRPTNAN